MALLLHHTYINIQSNIDLMDVCCSGGQSIVTVLPSKKEVVPSFFSRLASTISMRIFCHRRAQEDRSDYIGGVGREGQCLIRKLGGNRKGKWGGSRLTCCWLGRTVRGSKETRAAKMDRAGCRRLDGDIPAGREATELT